MMTIQSGRILIRSVGRTSRTNTIATSFQQKRTLATPVGNGEHVRIVEVSPRDGLQNEKGLIPASTKVELIHRLRKAGAKCIESGSFVSPKWVPQMKDTSEILRTMQPDPSISHPVLVPNDKGLDLLLKLLEEYGSEQQNWPTNEIAIFTAASEEFCKANTNCSIQESLQRLAKVSERALNAGLRVRGYISVVAHCPYQGKVKPEASGEIAEQLLQMGCYEISLGDTVGSASPSEMRQVLAKCLQKTSGKNGGDVSKYAAHCHDTMGTGLANVLALVREGVRSVDSAVGGLGGCPYSPGATGNIDTESVVYGLHAEGYQTGIDLEQAAKIGQWISEQVGKQNNSSAGRAILARLARQQKETSAKL